MGRLWLFFPKKLSCTFAYLFAFYFYPLLEFKLQQGTMSLSLLYPAQGQNSTHLLNEWMVTKKKFWTLEPRWCLRDCTLVSLKTHDIIKRCLEGCFQTYRTMAGNRLVKCLYFWSLRVIYLWEALMGIYGQVHNKYIHKSAWPFLWNNTF